MTCSSSHGFPIWVVAAGHAFRISGTPSPCSGSSAGTETGADLGTKLPQLATYLGHVGLTSTQDYLHMTEDLVGEVVTRQRKAFGDVITEPSR